MPSQIILLENLMIQISPKNIDKQKKRKKVDVENKDTIISKPKKSKSLDVIKICDKK